MKEKRYIVTLDACNALWERGERTNRVCRAALTHLENLRNYLEEQGEMTESLEEKILTWTRRYKVVDEYVEE
jgi:exonuclease VII small subunit